VESSFCPLPDDLRAVFESLKTSACYGKGTTIFLESDPCHSVFMVCQGSIKLVTGSTEGKVLLLRFVRPGEFLGLAEALLGQSVYESSAIAAESSVVAVVPRETFVRFVASYSAASLRVIFALSEQYKAAQREAKFLAFGETSTSRLAHLLLDWLAERGQELSDGVSVPAPVTHTELAQLIGSTRETVTRVLADLDHRGIIERRSDEIVIRSAGELTRIAAH
jgi:CRP/FNR family transcriptional regulator